MRGGRAARSRTRWVTPIGVALALVFPGSAPASENFNGNNFYAGDPHAHTGVSGDGAASDMGAGCAWCGAMADVFEYATVQGLDWVAFSDHSNDDDSAHISLEPAFDAFQRDVIAHDDDADGLVLVPAAEIWLSVGGQFIGHKNLLLFGDDATLASYVMTDAQPAGTGTEVGDCSAIATWMDSLTARYGHALLIPHHPAGLLPAPTDWSCHSDVYEPGVEVYSHWGNSLGWSRDWETSTDPQPDSTVHAALDPGGFALHLGFLGGTDGHDTQPGNVCDHDHNQPYAGGLTMIVLDESVAFSREAIYGAIVARSTYATTGPRVAMTLEYLVDGVVVGTLGQDVELQAGKAVVVRVTLPEADALNVQEALLVAPDEEIPLDYVSDGVFEAALDPDALPAWVYAAVSLDGRPYEISVGCDDGGESNEWLWASPTWFTVVDADGDADGYSLAVGDCDDTDAATHPGATELWYDGHDQNCDRRDDYDKDGDGYRNIGYGGSDCDDSNVTVRRPPVGHRVPADCRF